MFFFVKYLHQNIYGLCCIIISKHLALKKKFLVQSGIASPLFKWTLDISSLYQTMNFSTNFSVKLKGKYRRYKLNDDEKIILLFNRVENIAGKGENAGYKHFLLFPLCFQKPFFSVIQRIM